MKVKLVVVCDAKECRMLHRHKLLNGIRICNYLQILKFDKIRDEDKSDDSE